MLAIAPRKDGRISMVVHKPVHTTVLSEDAYRFAPSGRLAWLQRGLWWCLRKLKALAPHFDEIVTYKRIEFNADKALNLIMNSTEAIYSVRGVRPEKVLIGAEDFADIMHDNNINDLARFGVDMSFTGAAGFDRTLYGLQCHRHRPR